MTPEITILQLETDIDTGVVKTIHAKLWIEDSGVYMEQSHVFHLAKPEEKGFIQFKDLTSDHVKDWIRTHFKNEVESSKRTLNRYVQEKVNPSTKKDFPPLMIKRD